MTINELGSLGEIIGAIGLFLSIGFVAYELRLKMGDERSREYETLLLEVIKMNLAVTQSVRLQEALTKWWRLTDGMWGPVEQDTDETCLNEVFSDEERTCLSHYWVCMSTFTELALMKGERQAYDAELNKDGFGNMVEYTKLFQAFGKAKQKHIDKVFRDQEIG